MRLISKGRLIGFWIGFFRSANSAIRSDHEPNHRVLYWSESRHHVAHNGLSSHPISLSWLPTDRFEELHHHNTTVWKRHESPHRSWCCHTQVYCLTSYVENAALQFIRCTHWCVIAQLYYEYNVLACSSETLQLPLISRVNGLGLDIRWTCSLLRITRHTNLTYFRHLPASLSIYDFFFLDPERFLCIK